MCSAAVVSCCWFWSLGGYWLLVHRNPARFEPGAWPWPGAWSKHASRSHEGEPGRAGRGAINAAAYNTISTWAETGATLYRTRNVGNQVWQQKHSSHSIYAISSSFNLLFLTATCQCWLAQLLFPPQFQPLSGLCLLVSVQTCFVCFKWYILLSNIKELPSEVSNMDHLVKFNVLLGNFCSWYSYRCYFDTHHLPKHCCRRELLSNAPKKMTKSWQCVVLASKLPRSQLDWASIGRAWTRDGLMNHAIVHIRWLTGIDY